MTVALYVTNEKDANNMIPWGIRYAYADHTDLLIVCPRRSKGKHGWADLERGSADASPLHQSVFAVLAEQDSAKVLLKQDVAAGAEEPDLVRVLVDVRELTANHPEQAFAEEVASLDVTLLLLPAHEPRRTSPSEQSWGQELYYQAPCDTAFIRGPAPDPGKPFRVLVATGGGDEADVALERARQLAQTFDGRVTVLYVRPNDDLVAAGIAKQNLQKLIDRSTGMQDCYDPQISLANDLVEGVLKQDLDDHAMVLVGSKQQSTIQKVFRGLSHGGEDPLPCAVSTIRGAIPLTSLALARFQQLIRSRVPQMHRDSRIELVDKLQTNSRFDFDFVALISLSTLIATLGLMRNSVAVVIGAMLVAPLMTPLVGIGFALIQGNVRLIRDAMRSVVLGFAVAFVIGVALGLVVPGVDVGNAEISGRGHPNLLDLVVALASGIAGAYAMARPNLVGALPGVAIAAALVPPIASSGIAFAHLEFILSFGALLLFLTNIVYIVLGTTVAFWAVGLNSTSQGAVKDGQRTPSWPRYWFFSFVIISFVLAAAVSYLKL